jgi:hypothetical protein
MFANVSLPNSRLKPSPSSRGKVDHYGVRSDNLPLCHRRVLIYFDAIRKTRGKRFGKGTAIHIGVYIGGRSLTLRPMTRGRGGSAISKALTTHARSTGSWRASTRSGSILARRRCSVAAPRWSSTRCSRWTGRSWRWSPPEDSAIRSNSAAFARGGVRPPVGIAGSRHGVDVGPRRVQRHDHVGHLCLHELEAADRRAELLALAHIGQHRVEAGLKDTELGYRSTRRS